MNIFGTKDLLSQKLSVGADRKEMTEALNYLMAIGCCLNIFNGEHAGKPTQRATESGRQFIVELFFQSVSYFKLWIATSPLNLELDGQLEDFMWGILESKKLKLLNQQDPRTLDLTGVREQYAKNGYPFLFEDNDFLVRRLPGHKTKVDGLDIISIINEAVYDVDLDQPIDELMSSVVKAFNIIREYFVILGVVRKGIDDPTTSSKYSVSDLADLKPDSETYFVALHGVLIPDLQSIIATSKNYAPVFTKAFETQDTNPVRFLDIGFVFINPFITGATILLAKCASILKKVVTDLHRKIPIDSEKNALSFLEGLVKEVKPEKSPKRVQKKVDFETAEKLIESAKQKWLWFKSEWALFVADEVDLTMMSAEELEDRQQTIQFFLNKISGWRTSPQFLEVESAGLIDQRHREIEDQMDAVEIQIKKTASDAKILFSLLISLKKPRRKSIKPLKLLIILGPP